MDFYNPLYWSLRDGIYNLWFSVYPPLNFIILQLFDYLILSPHELFHNSDELREYSGLKIIYVIAIYIILMGISIYLSFKNEFSRNQLILIGIILILSPPTLFALERGNMIFISILFLTLFIYSKTKIGKILSFAILVNLKPYFLCFYFFEIIKKRKNEFDCNFLILSPLISITILLITGFILDQEYYLLPLNLLGFFSNSAVFSTPEIFAMPITVIAFSYLNELMLQDYFPKFLLFIPKLLIYIYLIKSIIIIIKKDVDFNYLITFIIVFITNYSITTGGYSVIYYIPVIPLLYKNKDYAIILTVMISMYLGLWDMLPVLHIGSWEFDIYLSGEHKRIYNDLTLGGLIRPIGNFIVAIMLYRKLKDKYEN